MRPSNCHERGGNLATVTTEAEWNQIKQQLGNSINGLTCGLEEGRQRTMSLIREKEGGYGLRVRPGNIHVGGDLSRMAISEYKTDSLSTGVILRRAQITSGMITPTKLWILLSQNTKSRVTSVSLDGLP